MSTPEHLNYHARRILDDKYQRVMEAQQRAAIELQEYSNLRASYGLPPALNVDIADEDNRVTVLGGPEEEEGPAVERIDPADCDHSMPMSDLPIGIHRLFCACGSASWAVTSDGSVITGAIPSSHNPEVQDAAADPS